MEKSNYEIREEKLLKRGKRVSYGTLVFSLFAAIFAIVCLLLQYGVIPLEGMERIVLFICLGVVTVAVFLAVLIDSVGYRKQFRAFVDDYGEPNIKN